MSRLLHIPSKIAVWVVQSLIRGYQLTISPLLGQCCRFEPSCSTYSQEAFATHGFFKGLWLTVVRVAKCGPFHDGGYDPVPEKGVAKPCIGACHAKPFVAHTKAASKKAKEEGLPKA